MTEPSPLRVLIVEDDADTCANLQDILELDGHETTFAHTAAETLGHPQLPGASVILLDRKLPDAIADDLLPRLKQAVPVAEVIIITGHADLDSAIAALRHGATDYLLKPINPEALRISLRRIAERCRLMREKAQSESAFQNVVETAPCMIVILRPDRTIAYFSPFAEQLTGYSAEDVLGCDYFELFLPEAERAGVAAEMEHILAGKPTRGYQNPVICRDGTLRWMAWNAQRLDEFEGEGVVLGIGQDVTEYKQAMERLVQSERLTALGEAMTSLAHESRNALQRSQASLEMLARRIDDRPETVELLGRIQNAQDDLHQLYEEVREYASPLRLNPQSCRLDDLLQEAWDHLAHQRADRQAELHHGWSGLDVQYPDLSRDGREAPVPSPPTPLPAGEAGRGRSTLCSNPGHPTEPFCFADRFALRQVLRNILENSLIACEDPVQIEVDFADIQRDGRSWIQCSIRDNGPGFNPEQRERIFEPFYTTKTHGTGLGMAICKRFVEAHGGRIDVGPGPGAHIVLTLPQDEGSE